MTAEERCAVIKEVYQWAMFAAPGKALYLGERMYAVRNNIGLVVLVRTASEAEAIEQAAVRGWVSCSTPPPDGRNVFLAHGTDDFKSCCIGHYDHGMKQWYEDRNFFASPIYDCKYWCDIPELPDMGDKQFSMPEVEE